jgi:hypothetical protein
VATSQTTASTTYTDLATVGPSVTVTIPASGKALVTVTGSLTNATNAAQSNMGFAITGATTQAASDTQALVVKNGGAQAILVQGSATFFISGLNTGSTTFTAKYRVSASSTGTFVNRSIIVVPLP